VVSDLLIIYVQCTFWQNELSAVPRRQRSVMKDWHLITKSFGYCKTILFIKMTRSRSNTVVDHQLQRQCSSKTLIQLHKNTMMSK